MSMLFESINALVEGKTSLLPALPNQLLLDIPNVASGHKDRVSDQLRSMLLHVERLRLTTCWFADVQEQRQDTSSETRG